VDGAEGAVLFDRLLLMLNHRGDDEHFVGADRDEGDSGKAGGAAGGSAGGTDAARDAAAEQGRSQRAAVYQQCLQATIPARQVIYTEDPAEAARLLEDGGGYSCIHSSDGAIPRGPHMPVQWNGPKDLGNATNVLQRLSDLSGTVYLHERHASPGNSRLIWCIWWRTRITRRSALTIIVTAPW